jgi:hypothetical protein
MAFGKTFILSLLAFIGLNFGFAVIVSALAGTIGTFFTSLADMSVLADALCGPISLYPGTVIGNYGVTPSLVGSFFETPIDLSILLTYIFYIVAPLLAAIIAGRLGESRGECFGAWFLTAMIVMAVALVLELIANSFSIGISVLLGIILGGVVTAFFYGCFALLLVKSEFY